MNIVFIGPFGLQPKSTMSTRALPLAKALARKGHTITILIPPWDDPKRASQQWVEDGVKIINVSLPMRVPVLFYILLTRSLVAKALQLQPDVIHFFKPKAYAGLAHVVLWWLRQLGGLSTKLKLVVDSDDWEQAWNDISDYSAVQKKVFVWQEQWGLRHADTVTVASKALETLVQSYRPHSNPNIFYIPNGYTPKTTAKDFWTSSDRVQQNIPTEQTIRNKYQLGDAPTLLLYSRFVEFKVQRIVRLVRLVAKQMPYARWLVVGQGLQGEEKALAAQLAEINVSSQMVQFAGWVPYQYLNTYFEAINVVVFPYDNTLINRTKCSIKLIDLLLSGQAVVADAVGQNKEYIEHDISGMLIPPDNDQVFADTLIALLQQPEKQHLLGQAATRKIKAQFNWDKLSTEVKRAYHA